MKTKSTNANNIAKMTKIPIFVHIIKKNKVIPTSKPSYLSINTNLALLVRKPDIYGMYAW
jgi:hypothetical protein